MGARFQMAMEEIAFADTSMTLLTQLEDNE